MIYSIKRIGILSALLLYLAFSAGAQDVYNSSGRRVTTTKKKKSTGFDKDKLILGAGIVGLRYGDGLFSIGLAPLAGYRITENFSAGVGLGFQYFSIKDYYHFYNSSTGEDEFYPRRGTFYYPSVWARYLVFRNFFVHVEGEYDMQQSREYHTDANGYPEKVVYKYNSPAVLVGAGFRQPMSDNSSLVIMALYDVIQHEYSPYKNTIDLRVGFNLGF